MTKKTLASLWLNSAQIRRQVAVTSNDLVRYLRIYHDMRGGSKRVVLYGGEYFLNPDYMAEFMKKFNLVDVHDVPRQDENWISGYNLCKIFHALAGNLFDVLRAHKDDADMRDANGVPFIQFRRTAHDRYVSLCVLNSDEALSKLAAKAGWQFSARKQKYKLRHDWTDKREFSDDEIHDTIINLLIKDYKYASEYACADALMSELPKRKTYDMTLRNKRAMLNKKGKSR